MKKGTYAKSGVAGGTSLQGVRGGVFDSTLFVNLGWFFFFWFVLFAEDVRSAPVLGMGWVYVLVCDFGCE